MADNYLERKMEELHSRGNARACSSSAPRGAGFLSFRFPPRHVLIVAPDCTCRECLAPVAAEYARRGCRVAVLSCDDGWSTASDGSGIRKIIAADDASVRSSFLTLMKSWRKLEILVGFPSETLQTISSLWKEYSASFPAPGFFTPRVLLILQTEIRCIGPGDAVPLTDETVCSVPHIPAMMFLSTEESVNVRSVKF